MMCEWEKDKTGLGPPVIGGCSDYSGQIELLHFSDLLKPLAYSGASHR